MQFEWWRKREKRKPAIRLVRDSSSDEGGARSVVTFLFWNGAQWRRRWFISWVSASISEQSALLFPNRRKASKLKLRIWTSRVFCLASSSSRSGYGYFSSTLCTLRRSIDHASRYLFFFVFPSAVSSSICPFIRHFIIASSLFFFLDLRSNPFFVVSWFFFPFDPRFHFRSREKRKTRWNVILFADIWRRQFFGRRGQTGYELQSRTSTRPTFHV